MGKNTNLVCQNFFLELFSEEIPPRLQINARKKLFLDLNNFFKENNINVKGSAVSYSTPNRVIINFSNISKEVVTKSEEIRGPSINSKPEALDGFLKSHNIKKSKVVLRSTDKGEFYFYNKPEQTLKTQHLLKKNLISCSSCFMPNDDKLLRNSFFILFGDGLIKT